MLFFWLFLFGVVESQKYSPMGIKMCEEKCQMTVECQGVLYDPVHLSCELQFQQDHHTNSDIVKVPVTPKGKMKSCWSSCGKGNKCILGNHRRIVCTQTEESFLIRPVRGDACEMERNKLVVPGGRTHARCKDMSRVVIQSNIYRSTFAMAFKHKGEFVSIVFTTENETITARWTQDINEVTFEFRLYGHLIKGMAIEHIVPNVEVEVSVEFSCHNETLCVISAGRVLGTLTQIACKQYSITLSVHGAPGIYVKQL